MKRDAPGHRKMRRLCKLLHLPLYSAVGLLELLWHHAGRYFPRGDIGRLTDEEIALAVGWKGSAQRLVGGLSGAGWLDPDPEHRFVIHDWHEHCDQAVRKVLYRKGLTFIVSGQRPDVSGQRPDMDSLPVASSQKPVASSQTREASGTSPPANGAAMYTWKTDESFQLLKAATDAWGAPTIDEDWQRNFRHWCLLDGEQKTLAVANIHAKREIGDDPRFWSLDKWLSPYAAEFKRPVVPPRPKAKPRALSPFEKLTGAE